MSGSNIGMENKRPLEVGAKTTDCGYRGVLPYRFIAASLLLAFIAISLCIAMDGESIDADPPSSGDCGGGLEWKYEDYKLKITKSDSSGFTGIMDDYKEDNPSPWNAYADDITMVEITGYTVRIGDYAFYKLTELTTLNITDNTTTPDLEQIGDHAFYGCEKLGYIKFGGEIKVITDFSNLTSIGNYAFYECDLQYIQGKDLTFPSELETIGDHAFEGCYTSTAVYWRSLEFYDWDHPDSSKLSYIGDYAFYGCKFNDLLAIPHTVETIGKYAFAGNSFGYHLYLYRSDATEPTKLRSIGDYAFYGCNFTSGDTTPLIIPNTVETIGNHAFDGGYRSGLVHDYPMRLYQTKPEDSNLTIIGDHAFDGCQFTNKLTIPNKVTYIGEYAFSGCTYSGGLTIPNSVTSIGKYAFNGCGFDGKLTLGSGITEIKNYAFNQCKFTGSLTIPNKVTIIGEYAFSGCNFNGDLNLGSGITKIGKYAFNECKFKGSLTIPDKVTTIGDYTFNGSKFTGSLTIKDEVTYIGKYAFNDCGFNGSLTLGASVTQIGDYAFNGCKFTGDLTIKDEVTSIGKYAFNDCGFNGSLTLGSSITQIGEYAFNECGFTGSLAIPDSVTSIGEYAFNECGFTDNLTISNNATSIGDYTFNKCGFTGNNLTIPNSVTYIGDYAFNECKFKGSLAIPGKVTTIGDHAFDKCDFDGTLTLADSITEIGEYAFNENDFKNSLVLPRNLTSINQYTFYKCDFTGSLLIPNGVETIGEYAFSECSFNGTLTLSDNLTRIGSSAFENSKFTGPLYIPDGITKIESQTFKDCNFSGPLRIPDGVIEIGYYAFSDYYCYECDLILPSNLKTLGKYAFLSCGFNKLFYPSTIREQSEESFVYSEFRGGLELDENIRTIPTRLFTKTTFGGLLNLPDGVKDIGYEAFKESKFEGEFGKVHVIPDSVTYIGANSFQSCRLEDGKKGIGQLQLSKNVAFFGAFAFYSSQLSIIELVLAPDVFFEGEGYTKQFFEGSGLEKVVVMTTSIPDGFYFAGQTLYEADGVTPIDNYNSDKVYLHIFPKIDGHLTQSGTIVIHTISYDTDGGSKPGPATANYYEGEMITVPDYTGTKAGYSFTAWICDDKIYLPGDTFRMSTSSMEFKAAWDQSFKVVYEVNGGSEEGPKTEHYKPGTAVTIQGYDGSKSGYSFGGWTWNGNTYNKGDQITISDRSITLSAKWIPYHKVTYDINGGSGTAPTQEDMLEGATFKVKSYSGTKTGYLFDGWICDGKVYQAGDTIEMGKKDLILMAVWTRLHSVTYELNGGEGDVPKQSDVGEGHQFIIKACTATMKDHVFKGWSYDHLLFQEGDIITMELDDIVLEATWARGAQTHKVTYDLQGGSGEAPIQADVPEGSTFIVKAYAGTKEGYRFGGWLYDSKVYMMGATIKMGTEDIVLQAVWNSGEPEDDDSSIRTILMIAGAAVGGLAVLGGVAFIFLRRF